MIAILAGSAEEAQEYMRERALGPDEAFYAASAGMLAMREITNYAEVGTFRHRDDWLTMQRIARYASERTRHGVKRTRT